MSKSAVIISPAHKRGKRVRDPFIVKKRAPSNKSLDKKIKRLQQDVELKHHDVAFTNAFTIPRAGDFQLLNGIAEGDSNETREGDDINMTSVQFRGQIFNSDTNSAPAIVRHLIFWDRQSNGSTPIISDVLDTSNVGNASFNVYAPYNENNQMRFKILYDKTWAINHNMATQPPASRYVYRKKRKATRRIKYNGTAATIGSIFTNALWALWISDDPNDTNTPAADCVYRVYYKDP